MTDFNKILEKAKEIEKKMKESQENLKKIEVNGVSGGEYFVCFILKPVRNFNPTNKSIYY